MPLKEENRRLMKKLGTVIYLKAGAEDIAARLKDDKSRPLLMGLTDEEKVKMCEIVSASGADYIKTSTGFSTGGATFDDIALFAAHVAPHLKIKAAGGISGLEDAEKFLALGASRLGTSRVVKAVKAEQGEGYYGSSCR